MQETQIQPLSWEDPLEKENGNLLQQSCLENPRDRAIWWATVHGVANESDMAEGLNINNSKTTQSHTTFMGRNIEQVEHKTDIILRNCFFGEHFSHSVKV